MNVSLLLKKNLAGAAALAFTIPVFLVVAATPAKADWPNTNATKWVQMPNAQNGLDVLATQLPGRQPVILADDFLCIDTGPIFDIHIWASWLGDQPVQDTVITLGIWSDQPKTTNSAGQVTPSHPDRLLWSETFAPGQYVMQYWMSSQEQFWDPDMGPNGILGPDHAIWQYNFYPTNVFVQQGTTAAPVTYWLSMTAVAGAVGTAAGPPFGWKTSDTNWNDNAVFGHLATNGIPLGDWQELFNPTLPAAPVSLDLAFALTTSSTLTNPPPAPTNKWLQPPNTENGMDVRATMPDILADDFLCTMAGTITNIQIWTSWLSDMVDSNATFTLGIWSDVPAAATAGAVTFSHPGLLLWSQTFGPGAYSFTLYANGQETFYDPNAAPPGGIIGSDTKVWLYDFNPAQPFCQQGSPNGPVVYWLSMTARPTTGALTGWKTSTLHWNDDAVHGHVTATGTALGDWMDMHNPTSGASLDLSFLINNGPPGPDCDSNQVPKFVQWPDKSSQGLDVEDVTNKILGDDFLCKSVGPIDGVTVWGSWLNNLVDSNATFQLGLWTDVPAVTNAATNAPSHPGRLLCTETFLPPQTIGTSVQRYQYGLYASNLQETFYNPDLAGTSGFIGADTEIWRYDFYPQNMCWKQRGEPVAPEVYWISLSEIPSPSPAGSSQLFFGWKTSTNHYGDDAVVGHLDTNNNALGDWKDMHDPRTSNSLDLSFELRAFPIVGINKDLKNTTSNVVDGLQIILAGIHVITWHYDGIPPWPVFSLTYVGGNTVLTWSGQNIAPGAIIHVGFDIAGATLPPILGMNWLQGGVIVGHPIQGCFHTWNNFNNVTVNNCLSVPALTIIAATVEFYPDVLRLDLMNSNSVRNPISSNTLAFTQPYVMAGGATLIPIPPAPPNALYGMVTVQLGDQSGAWSTTDYLLFPLDAVLQPVLTSVGLAGGTVNFTWSAVPGRIYHVQSSADLMNWIDAGLGDLSGDGDTLSASVPMSASKQFYRIVLVPQ
jgi:hypothetical protein